MAGAKTHVRRTSTEDIKNMFINKLGIALVTHSKRQLYSEHELNKPLELEVAGKAFSGDNLV